MGGVRQAALAGSWYQSEPKKLRESVSGFIQGAKGGGSSFPCNPLALVAPHAGHAWSGNVAGHAYNSISHPEDIRRVFILCPNHRVPVDGVVTDSVDYFSTPLGSVGVDRVLLDDWLSRGVIGQSHGAHAREHAIEIQLPFLQVLCSDFCIVPLIVGHLNEEELHRFSSELGGELGSGDLLLISSDFLHYGAAYGYVPFGEPIIENIRRYDDKTFLALSTLDAEVFGRHLRAEPHCACGAFGLWVMSAVFDAGSAQVVRLSYQSSAMISGETDMSVSYMAVAVLPKDCA